MLKVFIAPFVDAHWSRALGKWRSWILPLQTLLLLVMCCAGASETLSSMGWLVVIMNLLTATQDIAVDGFAIDCTAAANLGFRTHYFLVLGNIIRCNVTVSL